MLLRRALVSAAWVSTLSVAACSVDERAVGDADQDTHGLEGSAGSGNVVGSGAGNGSAGDAAVPISNSAGATGSEGLGAEPPLSPGSAGSATDTGNSAAAGSGNQPQPCDATAFPASNACVVSEDFGVFVAPAGDDSSGDGSRARPFHTLGRAVQVAHDRGRRVYACATGGSFAERLQLGPELDGLQLFGGFSCSDWSYDTALVTRVDSPFPSALELSGITAARFENLQFSASAALTPGSSSIAALIVDSQNVSFVGSAFVAGAGAAGQAGQTGAAGEAGSTPGAGPGRGSDASCTADLIEDGPPGATNACGSSSGHGGGTVPPPIPFGFFGGTGAPGADNAGAPGDALGDNGGIGGDGISGASGLSGAPSPGIGSFAATGYTPPAGGTGIPGGAGQGGGGGAAGNALDETDFCRQALGGAGGLGGCGGKGGSGGQGGGASVALLSWNSQLTLSACQLRAAAGGAGGDGGNGGPGGAGEAGAPGGAGGSIEGDVLSILSGDGGRGGRGGAGGTAGGGGGGAGGPSIGIVAHGNAPALLDGSSMQTQGGGAGGRGGPGGPGRAPNGAQGQTLDSLAQ